jgi:prepilin-type processing-associated H-X9-DG protein
LKLHHAVGICVVSLWILAAVVYPLIGGTSHRPMQPMCLSNAKQTTLAMAMYLADWDERMAKAANWRDAVLPYTKREEVFRCPNTPDQYGYAMVASMSGADTSKIDPKLAAKTPILFESEILVPNPAGALSSQADPPRHNGKNAIGFLDGHAKMTAPGP